MAEKKFNISEALNEERQIMRESKEVTEISEDEKEILRSLLREGLL